MTKDWNGQEGIRWLDNYTQTPQQKSHFKYDDDNRITKIYHFSHVRVCDSVALSSLIELYHQDHLIPSHSHHPWKNLMQIRQALPILLFLTLWRPLLCSPSPWTEHLSGPFEYMLSDVAFCVCIYSVSIRNVSFPPLRMLQGNLSSQIWARGRWMLLWLLFDILLEIVVCIIRQGKLKAHGL